MKKEIYLLVKFNETHLLNTISDNQFKHFIIQTSISNESTSADENLSLFIKKNQNKSVIKNEVMQNDNYIILSVSFI